MKTSQRGYLATGQTRCYDAFGRLVPCSGSGQDAEYRRGLAWPSPRFETTNEHLVLDRLTGLVWCRDAGLSDFPLSWDEALAFVGAMNSEGRFGFNDWRLLNRRELRSLISHQTRRPALPEDHPFRNVFPGWYWTSTSAAISPRHAWYVSLDGGRMFYGGKDQSFMVWPVRGGDGVLPATGQVRCYDAEGRDADCRGSGQDGEYRRGRPWPEPRYELQGEVACDASTGVVWRRAADLCGPVTWEEALRAATRPGWRLPNINELESLVDCAHSRPALPPRHPFRDLREVYWSSSTSLFEPDWAWALYLDQGAVGVGQKRHARFSVWLVQDRTYRSPPIGCA